LTASWTTIPHVTHFEEADITALEELRKSLNNERSDKEPGYSPLVFVIKAVAATLADFPLFNCSLLPGGDKVVLKRYCHLGIAVDTPQGLVVPVIRDADRKGLRQIAQELQHLSSGARAGKLTIPRSSGRVLPSPVSVGSAVPASPRSSTHRRSPSLACRAAPASRSGTEPPSCRA
jgi:pyruvate dehydrogenase E2 component (dihydrolipoamide acetyltransferase)